VDERYEAELARSTRVLDDVDRALERLSQGTYGRCEICATPIRPEDLSADPTRWACEQHLALDPGGRTAAAGDDAEA
jgi:RNA polymerase-binding transcription factor DksA